MHDLLDRLSPILGPCRFVADHTWPEWREAAVVEVSDAEGQAWFAKRHRSPERYHRELRAYRRWVPALGDRAPSLRGFDDENQLLVVSGLSGAPPTNWRDHDLLRQAGRLLRGLHDAEQLGPWNSMVVDRSAELEYWLQRGTGLIERRVVDFVRSGLASLHGLAPPSLAPCHGDFTPRNWLVAGSTLRVFDFGESRPDAWISDLARLVFGWQISGEELDVLLSAYGRRPSDEEILLLRANFAVELVWQIVWGHEHRNDAFESSCRAILDALLEEGVTSTLPHVAEST